MLSRFIIHLRQLDATTDDSLIVASGYSIPSLRVPTIDNVVGNLGEPLEFGREYSLDDDEADTPAAAAANGWVMGDRLAHEEDSDLIEIPVNDA